MSLRCADAADDAPLAGTASRADRFVLIETAAPWPAKAEEAVDAELAAEVERSGAKLLLVRRSGTKTAGRRWAVVDARRRRIQWGALSEDGIRAALAGEGQWGSDPLVLVCTHARRDACCGVRGRPTVLALTKTHPDLVWESSHVGGHRFAGNLVLPLDGTYYGRVDADAAPDLVEAHLNQEVAADHLRGFSWLEPAAQAVAVEAHRRWGPASADDITDAKVQLLGPGRWRVELTGSQTLPSLITAVVEERAGALAPVSCGAEPEPTTTYVVTSLDAEGT